MSPADLMMPGATPLLAAAAAAVFLLAGVVKGVVGLGLPTISMALLALIMAPAQAAALLVVPSLVTNLWQARPAATFGPIWRRIAGMQAGACAGTLAGAWWLGAPSGVWAGVCLGVALVLYAAWGLFGSPPSIPTRRDGALGLAVGAATGLVTAATGVFVIPAVPYLQALGLEKDDLVQALGLSFTVSTIALAAGLSARGAFALDNLALSGLAVLPALAGMWAGQIVRRKVSPASFRRWFLVCLLLLGCEMLARPLL